MLNIISHNISAEQTKIKVKEIGPGGGDPSLGDLKKIWGPLPGKKKKAPPKEEPPVEPFPR